MRYLLILLGTCTMLGCDSFFYYPNARQYASPADESLRFESVNFSAENGPRLHGWFFPAKGEALGTVLHLHGNAGNITGHFLHTAWLPAEGWNVLCFDYRGYGQSAGKVTRAGTVADAHAALDYLLTRPDVDPQRVVVFGQSLGAAVGVVLAAERSEIRGLAIDGCFDSYRRIVAWHVRRNPLLFAIAWWYPSTFVPREHDPIDYIAKIAPRPVFIMQGTADCIINPAMAQKLYDAAGEPKELWLVDGADHYGAMQDLPEQSRPRLIAFFRSCLK